MGTFILRSEVYHNFSLSFHRTKRIPKPGYDTPSWETIDVPDIEHSYPQSSAFHIDDFFPFLIDLRRFVEQKLVGDVMYELRKMDYRYCWNLAAVEAKSYSYIYDYKWSDMKHGYHMLHFEHAADQVKLLANWGIELQALEIQDTHPDAPWHKDVKETRGKPAVVYLKEELQKCGS